MTRSWLALAVILGLSSLASQPSAQPKTPAKGVATATPKPTPKPTQKPAKPAPACAAARSALDTTARTIAAGLGRVPDKTLVVSAALATDTPAPRAAALSAKLTELVAGRLGAGVTFEPAPITLDEARPKAAARPGFVWLEPKISGGRLRLSADAYPVPSTVWSRARSRRPGPIAHAFAQARIDAEVRSFLRPIPFVDPKVAKFDGADPDIVAMACGDLDGDGGSDLVTMTRQRILQVRLADGKVSRVREAQWSDLAAVAPVPLRQPLGFTTIVEASSSAEPSGYLDVSLSDRAQSVRLDPDFAVLRKLEGFAVPSGRATACTWIYDLLLGDKLTACGPRDAAPELPQIKHRSDALAADVLVARNGTHKALVALRRNNGLVVRGPGGDMIIGRVGAQLAIGDVDQDGSADLVTTLDVLSRKHDVVQLRTVLPSGTVKRRFTLPVPTGVDALAICPPDGPGRAPIVLASKSQLWVLR